MANMLRMTSLCKEALSARKLKQILSAPVFLVILAGGWFFPFLGFFIPLCMVMGIALAFWRGRKWCDWLCPRGSFYDVVMQSLSPQKKIPAFLRSMAFRLGILAVLMIIMGTNLVVRWPHAGSIGRFFVIMMSVTTALGIILALILHQRAWCQICPIGTIINLMSKDVYPLKIDSRLCIACKACADVCPIQLKPYTYKEQGVVAVKEADCLHCNLCIAVCPKKALSR